ncbi:MAG TPA: ribose 5-phosphate isomerase A [Nitrososphaeraceae archaeon]|nr:ribose 5-phosphate isomerase A [Nitrososphaeraceae archaeon]
MAEIQNERVKNSHNWIPQSFQKSAEAIAQDAIKQSVNNNQVIGLGSGPMAAAIIREIGKLSEDVKKTLQCVASSTQIKDEALNGNLNIVDPNRIPEIDVVFDGADQVDSDLNMIKGGGGALLREKVLHSAARTIVITAESFKFVRSFDRSVPIEVHPFALYVLLDKLRSQLGVKPELRMLNEGYPYVTENGNFILDTTFQSIPDVKCKEIELKNIPGVVEVGLFTKHASVYYKANDNGSYETIRS